MNNEKPRGGRLSTRIAIYFSAVFLIAFVLLVIVVGRLYSDKLNAEMTLVVSQRLGLAGTALDHSLAEIKNLHFSLINDPALQRLMRLQKDGDGDIVAVRDELQRVGLRTANVRSVIAVSTRGKVLDPIYAVEPYAGLLLDNPEFEAFLRSQLTGRFSSPSTFPIHISDPSDDEKNTVTYFGHYYDSETYEDLGYLAISLKKYSLLNDLETQLRDIFDHAYILDENGAVILRTTSLPVPPLPDRNGSQGQQVLVDGEPCAAFSVSPANYANWRIVGFVSYRSIFAPLKNLYITIFLVLAVVLLAVFIASFSISHTVTAPIRGLVEAMKLLGRGEWPHMEPQKTPGEVNELLTGFNVMVDSLRALTAKISAEQEEKKKIEVAMVQSQLDLLQSQINPHFIHNTLNTMKYMAKKVGADELADLVVSFNSLLRTSMSQDNLTVTILEEVDNLFHYMRIQRERYDVDLEFVCDISENARGAMLPKLILQPLVENSLFHGIVPVGRGKIAVSARTGAGRLWITVWDNGAGIPPDKLEMLIQGILPNARGYNQIGLANVSERLVLNYGDSSRLVIQSSVNEGTSIGFSIPVDPSVPDDARQMEEDAL